MGFNQNEFGRLAKAVAQHMQARAGSVPDPKNQHQGALALTQMLAGNYQQVLLFRYFQMPAAAEAYAEQIRGSVNHTTSKFRLTEENAGQIAQAVFSGDIGERDDINFNLLETRVKEALLTVAARYEEGHPEPTPSGPNVN